MKTGGLNNHHGMFSPQRESLSRLFFSSLIVLGQPSCQPTAQRWDVQCNQPETNGDHPKSRYRKESEDAYGYEYNAHY